MQLFGEVAPEEALDRRNSRQSEQKPQPRQASDQQGKTYTMLRGMSHALSSQMS